MPPTSPRATLPARMLDEVAPYRPAMVRLAVVAAAWAVWVSWGNAALPAVLVAAVAGAALAVVDLDTHRLPNAISYPATLTVAALLAAAAAITLDAGPALRALVGGIALGAFYAVLHLIDRAGMGLGDVKLAPMLGALSAWFGWGTLLAAAVLPFLVGGVVALVLIVARRATRKTALAFGPVMLAGTALALTLARIGG